MAHWEPAVFQHQFMRKSMRRRGGGRAAMHWAEPQVVQFGLYVKFCVVYVILEVAVWAVAMVLDLLAKSHSLFFTRLSPRGLRTFVLFMAEKRHGSR